MWVVMVTYKITGMHIDTVTGEVEHWFKHRTDALAGFDTVEQAWGCASRINQRDGHATIEHWG